METLSHKSQSQSSIDIYIEAQPCQSTLGVTPDSPESAPSSNPLPQSALNHTNNRRVLRACDECRARKIKCDGRQPCLHCTIVDENCTYDQPSKRAKRLSQKDIGELELKLQRMQKVLKAILPDLDIDSLDLESEMLNKLRFPTNHGPPSTHTASEVWSSVSEDYSQRSSAQQDVPLETILDVTGQLDLDEQGGWSYHGHGSSAAFHHRLGSQFGNAANPILGKNTALRLQSIPSINESPRNLDSQSFYSMEDMMLPSKDVALELISSALDDGCALFKFVHEPSFYSMVHQMYALDPDQYGDKEHRFLPLLYAALALGHLFSNSGKAYFGNAYAVSQSETYFVAARQLLAITECRDLWSLQALLFIIIFLHSSARMSTCHSYISIAIAASLQMGLHSSEPKISAPIEREIRKRIFWTIRTMETYVIAILGLPRTISDDDIDQEMPLEIDDQYITDESILLMPEGQVSIITSFNAYTKLINILRKIVTEVYATKGIHKNGAEKPRAYRVNDKNVQEVERDLQYWARNLPMQLRPSVDSPHKFRKVQHLLRLAFSHVQLVLYRPFLHYISSSKSEMPAISQCYAYAAACVDVGRNVILNEREMERQNILTGPYWFSIYTTFCATLSLVFSFWQNSNDQGILETLKDAEYGRDILVKLAYKSMVAAKHSETLATIFDRLPEKLGRNSGNQPKLQRKRQIPSPDQNELPESRHNNGTKAPDNLSWYFPQTSPQATDVVNLNESPPPDTLMDPSNFLAIPERPSYGNFGRYLGPDPIEDIFKLPVELFEESLPTNISPTIKPLSEGFDSLDQYVSTLDLQMSQDHARGINDTDKESLTTNATFDNASLNTYSDDPFVPLSPYLMLSDPPCLISWGSSTFTSDGCSTVDKNNSLNGTSQIVFSE